MAEQASLAQRLDLKTTDLDDNKRYVVGVAVFRHSGELLLVKRAAHEDSFPNCWEIPGGHIEPEETIKLCVERETFEETGLVVSEVVQEFQQMHWVSKSGKLNVQFNFVVAVKDYHAIKLNPKEHSEHRWIGQDAVEELHMTSAIKQVLHNAFRVSNAR